MLVWTGAENVAITRNFLCVFVYSLHHPYLCLCRDCPAFCLLSVLHNTQQKGLCPGGIRTRNPSKRSAANPRLRPLGYWDQQIRSPAGPARSVSLCRLSYRGPQINIALLFTLADPGFILIFPQSVKQALLNTERARFQMIQWYCDTTRHVLYDL